MKKKTLIFVLSLLLVFSGQFSEFRSFSGVEVDAFESVSEEKKSDFSPKRIPEKEPDLNTLLFDNGDGTESFIIHKYPVKYIDDSGLIKDVDLNIKKAKNNYLFEVSDHFLHFGFLQSHVEISSGDIAIQLKNVSGSSAKNIVVSGNTITYEAGYDQNTHLRYMITYAGMDQELILDKYSGMSEFELIITGDNIGFEKNVTGGYSIISKTDNNSRFDIGDIVAFDSSGRFSEGKMSINCLSDDEFLLKISVDESFLSDDLTQYPVTIDPSFTWSAIVDQTYIEDTTIYSGRPTLNTGSWLYNHTGFVADGYNVGRMLVRLPGMYESDLYTTLLGVEITGAVFGIYEATGSAGRTVSLYPYTGTSWSEYSATWSNTSPNSYGELIDSKQPAYGGLSEYNILSLVKMWKENTLDEKLGFMLMSNNESNSAYVKAFNSAEHGSNVPYVKITYTIYNKDNLEGGTYYIRNKTTGNYLAAPALGSDALKNFDHCNYEKWQIYKNSTDGTYQIVSVSDYITPYGNNTYCLYGFSPQHVSTAIGTDTETDQRMNWHILSLANGIAFVNDKQNSHWLTGSSEGIGLSLTKSSAVIWELIECSNPYTINYNGNFDKINETDLFSQMNCYAFAMGFYKFGGENNFTDDEKLQPGEVYDTFNPDSNNQLTYSYLDEFFLPQGGPQGALFDNSKSVDDALDYIAFNCVEIDLETFYVNTLNCNYILGSSYEEHVMGPWVKVALTLDYTASNNIFDLCYGDYHWYIQQDDGTWCHKPGLTLATNLDSSENVIYDPRTCDRRVRFPDSVFYFEYDHVKFYKIHVSTIIKYVYEDLTTDQFDVAGDTLDKALPIGVFYGGGYSFKGKIEYGQAQGYTYSIDFTNSSDLTMSLPMDLDVYEFMVGVDGTYTFSSNSYSFTTGVLYEGDQYINHNVNSYYNDFGFLITANLTTGKLYRLCVLSDSTAFNMTYTINVTRSY